MEHDHSRSPWVSAVVIVCIVISMLPLLPIAASEPWMSESLKVALGLLD